MVSSIGVPSAVDADLTCSQTDLPKPNPRAGIPEYYHVVAIYLKRGDLKEFEANTRAAMLKEMEETRRYQNR